MKSLYESIMSKTGTGVEASINKWMEKVNPLGIHYTLKPVKGGYYVIYDDFGKSPHSGTINIDKSSAHDIPPSIKGFFYTWFGDGGKPEKHLITSLNFSNVSFTKMDISYFDFTQLPDLKFQTFQDLIKISFSNTDELVGTIKEDSKTKTYDIELHTCYIHKKLEVVAPSAYLYINDGVVINLHNIKGCHIHKLVIGDVALTHTAAVDRNLHNIDPYNDESLFVRSGAYYTNRYFTDLLNELLKNNKIDLIEYQGDMIKSKRGTSVFLTYNSKKDAFLAK